MHDVACRMSVVDGAPYGMQTLRQAKRILKGQLRAESDG